MRYYEREGLIDPTGKSHNGYRYYDDESAARVRFIKHCQRFGFTLAEIREMLVLRVTVGASCGDMRRLIEKKKHHTERKLRQMRDMVEGLDQLLATPVDEARPVAQCPIFAALEEGKILP